MENKKIFHQIASILTELIPIRLEALKQCRNTTDENWNEIENELSNAHDAQKMVQALKEDISELQNNADFERLEEILDEVLMISNHLYYIAGKDELQLKDDEETDEKEETEEK